MKYIKDIIDNKKALVFTIDSVEEKVTFDCVEEIYQLKERMELSDVKDAVINSINNWIFDIKNRPAYAVFDDGSFDGYESIDRASFKLVDMLRYEGINYEMDSEFSSIFNELSEHNIVSIYASGEISNTTYVVVLK